MDDRRAQLAEEEKQVWRLTNPRPEYERVAKELEALYEEEDGLPNLQGMYPVMRERGQAKWRWESLIREHEEQLRKAEEEE
jgi:hypothetical protein